MNFPKLSQSLIFTLVAISQVFVALFFWPSTSEFFELNKFTAILAITVLTALIWAAKMIFEKRTVFTKTPLDVPILILVAVFFVAAATSIDQFVSFFGKHGRIWPSFITIATLAALYFVVVSNLKTKKQVNIVLWALAGSAVIASIIAITSYFGAFLPFDFTQIRSFNTLGIVNRLALLQAFVIPITASWAIFENDKVNRFVATISTLILILSFILINSISTYAALAAALIFLALGTLKVKLTKAQQGSVAVLVVFTILFLTVRFVPQVAKGTLYAWIVAKDQNLTEEQQIDTPKENFPSHRSAWDIAAQSIGKRPIFGTGPGTYQFVYTQLKPRYVNGTDDWANRFERSSSDLTEIVATVGIFGVLAYLLLIIAIARYIWTLIFTGQNTIIYLPLTAAIVGYIVSNFFVPSSFATAAAFFIALALLSALAKAVGEHHVYDVTVELAALKSKFGWFPLGSSDQGLLRTEEGERGAKSQLLPWIFTTVVIILSFPAINYQVRAYRADYFYRQSLLASQANDGNKTVQMLQAAIQANGAVDTYHRALSQTALNAAVNLSRQGDLDEDQRQLLGQLAQVAIDQGKVASGYQILPLRLPGISAANAANWETLSSVYQALIGAINGADVHATNTLAQAISLDPQNPVLHNSLGQLYQRLGNLDLAQRKFEDAIIVKGDFGPAHYNLANILIEREGEVARIVNELTIAKRVLPQNDPALSDIDNKLETYNKKLREIQENAQSQQTAPETEAETKTKEEPSPSPSPSPTLSPSPSPSF